jgi:hypothetical protein
MTVALVTVLVGTHGQPTLWLGLRDLLVLASTSLDITAALDEMPHLWKKHADEARSARRSCYRRVEVAIAGVRRRRSPATRKMLSLTAAQNRAVRAVVPSRVLRRMVSETNASVLEYEDEFGSDPSRYPRGYCRQCVRYTSTLVWGGVCYQCFGRRDCELSARACDKMGLQYAHRADLPVRRVSIGWGVLKLHRKSDVVKRLARINNRGRRLLRGSRPKKKRSHRED